MLTFLRLESYSSFSGLKCLIIFKCSESTTLRNTHTHTHTRSFQHRGLECKSKKSRDTWSNRQVWFWGKKWSRAKANRILQREHIGHSKHLLPKHKRWLYTWASPDGQYQNQIDYILCSQRGRSSIQLAKTRLETDYGSEHELLIAKFRLELRK